jgi:hypothetical protein
MVPATGETLSQPTPESVVASAEKPDVALLVMVIVPEPVFARGVALKLKSAGDAVSDGPAPGGTPPPPPPPEAVPTAIESDWIREVEPVLSSTVTLKANGLPFATAGVPPIMPVAAFSVRPGGSAPELTIQFP